LVQWARDGIPAHPGSWLMATAKHRAIDLIRRRGNYEAKLRELGIAAERKDVDDPMAAVDEALASRVSDDLLRLLFTACHPVNTPESQVALTLRTVAGLRTDEIARAFLTSESSMGQRISRAKKNLTRGGVRFALPPDDELPERLGAVLGVIYLIFNEGYAASRGAAWLRPALCVDALRLGRLLAGLLDHEPEVHGLLALMELQASRIPARIDPNGEPVLLADQDRRRWDRLLIRRGLDSLRRAEDLGGGPYTIQAQIAACHAQAHRRLDTDWTRIVALYTVLAYLTPSPVVDLNRAVAIGMADGPERALPLLDELVQRPALARYPGAAAARATFLRQLGRDTEAVQEFERAAELTSNHSEQNLYRRQAEGQSQLFVGGPAYAVRRGSVSDPAAR
jgi:predicted RNA polymerase sigma factor